MALLSSYFARCPPPHSAVPFTGLFRPWLATNRSPITVQTVDITVAFRKLRETSRQVENTPTVRNPLASSRGIYCACVLSLSLSLDLSVSGYADSPPLLDLLSIGFLMLQQVMSCLDKDSVGWDVVVRCVDNFMVGVWDYVGGELKVKRCRLKGDVSQKSVMILWYFF